MTLKEAALYLRNHCNPALDDKTQWERATLMAIRSLSAWEDAAAEMRSFQDTLDGYLKSDDAVYDCGRLDGMNEMLGIFEKYLEEVRDEKR